MTTKTAPTDADLDAMFGDEPARRPRPPKTTIKFDLTADAADGETDDSGGLYGFDGMVGPIRSFIENETAGVNREFVMKQLLLAVASIVSSTGAPRLRSVIELAEEMLRDPAIVHEIVARTKAVDRELEVRQ